MPVFELQLPDQRVLTLEAPDQDTALRGAQEWHQANPIEPSIGGTLKQAGVGVGKAVVGNAGLMGDIGSLINASAEKIGIPEGVRTAVSDAARNSSSPLLRMTTGPGSADIQKEVEKYTGEFRKPQNLTEQYAQTIGEFAPAAAAGPGGITRRVAMQTVVPAVASEAAGQATKGTAAEPWARLAGGAVAPLALSMAGRALSPAAVSTERQAARDALRQEGVTDLTAGQITGSIRQRRRESMAEGFGQAMTESQLRQLTRAAVRRIGEDTDNVFDAIGRARPRIGQQIETSSQRLLVRQDPQLTDALVGSRMEGELLRSGLSADQERRILALRDIILDNFGTAARRGGGTPWTEMSGTALQNLIRKNSPLQLAIDGNDSIVAHYASRMKEAVLDAAERTAHRQGTQPGRGNRQALDDFRNARRQWANLRALEEAASMAGETAASGVLTPAAVRRASTARETTDYARGIGDFADIARNSNMIMRQLPSSGTAHYLMSAVPGRTLGATVGGLAGGVAGVPFLGVPPLTGGAMAIGAGIGGWLGPKATNAFTMSRPGQWLAGNRSPAWQPTTIGSADQLLRQLMLLPPATIPIR